MTTFSSDLDGNRIRSLPSNSINITTDQLSLANSQLESISDWAFNGSRIGTLQLNGNLHLKRLDRLAFRGLGSLRTLDLSDTALLSLPTVGLEDIERLLVKRTPSLMTFPSVYHFGSIEEAHLTYPYHCCAFDFPAIQDPDQHRKYQNGARAVGDGVFHTAVAEESSLSVCEQGRATRLRSVRCLPAPDAFNPCEDIMGYRALRVAVWVVVVTAIVGNVAVLVVLISRSFKLTTPKFLMCNLAFADLCMGVYLLIIASMDIHTIGVYFNHAIHWQEGVGCQVAGFVTVFGAELSVFTLVTITCERWYAITNAIYLTKRLRIGGAVRVMVVGWMYSAFMATLPLVGIGSYSKTSICLPMARDATDRAGIAFLLLLLLGNGAAFLLISWFYLRMYCSISHVERGLVRPNDLKVAKRMALLVFTDFACWAPIAFFGVTAIMGVPLISVTNSKILLVFFYPLNACANPYLYAIFTKQFRQELLRLLGRRSLCRPPPRSANTLLEMSSIRGGRKSSQDSAVESHLPAAAVEQPALSPVLECSRTSDPGSVAPPGHAPRPDGGAQ
ncbi:lutropin-choriogonadotropic hormone receptor-like [Pollicipes pollicipes]|uniref:lutropin-choriogonadotropic hormone receptor-like n=1 Tax=Pollicipes pollicipes TaxID=41117 RepID=UPI001884E985|nr:lutropin-choriogonadotropic hormone receptor-like [Pollicipes pollicipes]